MLTSREIASLLEHHLEIRTGLIERGDAAGLVAHLEAVVALRPHDPYALKDLGEAYVLLGEPEKALALLEPLYRRHPHFEPAQWAILDALFAAGKNETDFPWREVPTVLRLGAETLDACHRDLRLHGASDVEALYFRLLVEGYCAFSAAELFEALAADPRFVVEARVRRAGS